MTIDEIIAALRIIDNDDEQRVWQGNIVNQIDHLLPFIERALPQDDDGQDRYWELSSNGKRLLELVTRN
jgi:hypothetical protein